jgi:methionyl-tRNA formyltransferase
VQAELFALNPDLIVVVAYGMILPEEILNYPRYGCINIHPSLLPRWRGAAPIQHTLWSGDQETAVCIMQMDAGLDSGPILAMEKFSLDNQITSGELHDKLAQIGANLLINTIRDIDNIAPQVQPTEGLTYATKISKEDAKIDWNRPALQINNLIRAFNPTPGAYFIYNDERIKLLKAQVIKGNFEQKTGTVIDEQLLISCQADGLRPLILQRAGRQPVSLEEFLRGYQVPRGAVLV